MVLFSRENRNPIDSTSKNHRKGVQNLGFAGDDSRHSTVGEIRDFAVTSRFDTPYFV